MKSLVSFVAFSGSLLLLVISHPLAAQSDPKPGLWESQITSTHTISLPPEVEARLAAMPAAQQAQVRSMMGGGGASAPTVMTRQICIPHGCTIDAMVNRVQQSPGMQCSVSNRSQTASTVSFDITCTGATGSAKGHTEIHIVDSDHSTSTTHVTVTGTAQGHSMNSTVDTTTSTKFISADCGDVKPDTPPAPQ